MDSERRFWNGDRWSVGRRTACPRRWRDLRRGCVRLAGRAPDIGGHTVDLQVTDYVRDGESWPAGVSPRRSPPVPQPRGQPARGQPSGLRPHEVDAFARNAACSPPQSAARFEEAPPRVCPPCGTPGSTTLDRGPANRQFMLGDSLLMAPVMAPGHTEVTVSLPPGTWRHLITGEIYSGMPPPSRCPRPSGRLPRSSTPRPSARADRLVADVAPRDGGPAGQSG